jgi:hypothetical protein
MERGRAMEIDRKRLRQRCGQRLPELDLPDPFDVPTFCDLLAARRGRRIVLRAIAMDGGLSGAWVATPSMDVIFYERETSALHREQIILHEICHMLWEHQPVPLSEVEIGRLLFPELKPDVVQRMLQRAGYSTAEECEAELLASMILERAAPTAPSPSTGMGVEKDVVLHRLEASLEEERSGR